MGVTQETAAEVREICLALPGVTERLTHGSPGFFVGTSGKGKQFVMLWPDGHHDHEFPHLWCAAPAGVQDEMISTEPDRFFRPPYVGHRGWIGYRLDGEVDREEVRSLCVEAYRTVAPKRLADQLDPDE